MVALPPNACGVRPSHDTLLSAPSPPPCPPNATRHPTTARPRAAPRCAASITLPAAGAALVAKSTAKSVAHATVGLVLASILILQVIAGAAIRNWLRSDKPPPKHWMQVRWFHHVTGWLMVGLGLVNCVLGADMILPNGRWGVIAYVALVVMGFVAALAVDEVKRDQTAVPDALKFDTDEARRIAMSQAVNSMTIAEVRHNIQVSPAAEDRGVR
jgi:hypothetical protein